MFNITPWNEQKFSEIVQRINNALFVSVCQICPTRTKRPGKNSTWINDLNREHQKDLSKIVHKTQVVPHELNSQKLMSTKVIGKMFNIK